jgi:TolA-binding protein
MARAIIPDLFGISGDIILIIIIAIIIISMAAFIVKYLNRSLDLATRLTKELRYSKDLEEMNIGLEEKIDKLEAKVRRLNEKVQDLEMFSQHQQQQIDEAAAWGRPSQEYGVQVGSPGGYGEIEVVQSYEALPTAERIVTSAEVDTDIEAVAPAPPPPAAPVAEVKKEKAPAVAVAKAKVVQKPAPVEKEKDRDIQDVFVIYKDGRLITHLSRKRRIIDDSQIIGSMITAVQMCVRESFKREARGQLGAMKFGELNILMENGEFLNLAVVVRGGRRNDDIKQAMKDTLTAIHDAWSKELEDWDGTLTNIGALEKIIQKDLIDRFSLETFHQEDRSGVFDLSKAKVFKPHE